MKRVLVFIGVLLVFFSFTAKTAQAQLPPGSTLNAPIICGCPAELTSYYASKGEQCVGDVTTFQLNPSTNHLWIEDPEITAQGKTDERARQFIYWVINNNSIDNHPTLLKIWNTTRNTAYFLVILVVAVMGLGMIIAQRNNFSVKIKIWPSVFKVLMLLLYITFSATLVIIMIQLSEILMKFFIETLGGKDLFNIDFGTVSNEKSYLNFIGCRDVNYRVQEGFKSELFLLKMTNVTYYVMGIMLILRKVLLWFLLLVSPFLAILMPFVFVRNVGWIWIGVFFQWLFYGPLFALFLGALATIWKFGIPYTFDFSRINSAAGYVYPTAINILYGGPAQKLNITNNGNYVDTFTEYIISLVMLWAVTFFPWWLLRIFRDYCCDGINAMKNILLSMYDQTRGGPNPPIPSGPTPTPTNIGTALKLPNQVDIKMKVKMETYEEIKRAKTEDITRSLNITATKMTDIARFETNKQTQENVKKNLNFLANPTKAETPAERQKFMNIRAELFNRAVKEDHLAKQVLSSISSSRVEQMERKQDLLKTMPKMIPVTHVVSIKVKLAQDKVSSLNDTFTQTLAGNVSAINKISESTKLPAAQVQTVLTSYKQNVNQTPANVLQNISRETGVAKDKVSAVINNVSQVLKDNKELVRQVAVKENMKEEDVAKVIQSQIPLVTEPEKNIEQTVVIPPSVSIEDYEEVKKMWMSQYEKGEVPITENIQSRHAWVEQDTVFITNTLNKLLSANEDIKQQGLDDLGYILPVFLINNLKGEELVVYLRAKLEAAKAVKEEIEKEKEITEKVKTSSEDELIDVENKKVEPAAKTMEMKESLKIAEEKKPEEPPKPENQNKS